jgi:nucleotide-binding universal stress UspA family protein
MSTDPKVQPVVVGVDASGSARHAALWAAALAANEGRPLRAVHAEPESALGGPEPAWLRELLEAAPLQPR